MTANEGPEHENRDNKTVNQHSNEELRNTNAGGDITGLLKMEGEALFPE